MVVVNKSIIHFPLKAVLVWCNFAKINISETSKGRTDNLPSGELKNSQKEEADKFQNINSMSKRAVVVAQLSEQSLPLPDDPGSNPVIGNF